MRCPTCESSDVALIGFDAVDRATYRYCRVCERGWWRRTRTETVETEEIMQDVSSIPPARRAG